MRKQPTVFISTPCVSVKKHAIGRSSEMRFPSHDRDNNTNSDFTTKVQFGSKTCKKKALFMEILAALPVLRFPEELENEAAAEPI